MSTALGAQDHPSPTTPNRLTFVCAGTTDPQLLTVRAVSALASAQCVIADSGLDGLLAGVVGSETEVTFVHAATARAPEVLTSAIRRFPHTVRLLAGDPVLHGVLGQELQAFASKAFIDVVPGITTASTAAAFAGTSLVSDQARQIRVIDAGGARIDWIGCADPRTTLIITGGADTAGAIFKHLLSAGAGASTPFCIIRDAGTMAQRTVYGELGTADATIAAARQSGDGIIIVGDVMAGSTNWFERKPLFGWRVLLPCTNDRLDRMEQVLASHGASVTQVATLSVEPPRTSQQMEKAIAGVVGGRYGWIVFTCPNSFAAIWEKARDYGLDARVFAGLKLATVGEETSRTLQVRGLMPDLVTRGSTADLLRSFPDPIHGHEHVNRVLIPRAEIVTESLTSGLVQLGWEAEEVTAFRTVRSAPPEERIRQAIKTGDFDAVVFTSSATVRNLVGTAGKPHHQSLIACIGPHTAKTATDLGLDVDVLAPNPTHDSLVDSVVAHAFALQVSAMEAGFSTWRPSKQPSALRRKAK